MFVYVGRLFYYTWISIWVWFVMELQCFLELILILLKLITFN